MRRPPAVLAAAALAAAAGPAAAAAGGDPAPAASDRPAAEAGSARKAGVLPVAEPGSARKAGVLPVADPGSARAAAAAPRLQLLVAGRSRVLRGPLTVVAARRTVAVGSRRCAVAAGTPIAALAALRTPTFAVRDYGACSATDPNASELLYVRRIGPDAERGSDGWVFKVGRRALGVGGANPRARVRTGGRVLWFYCRNGLQGCQRTLEVTGPARAAPGAPVTFTVRGYDDRGRGVAVAGARVVFGGVPATTAADGSATLPAPSAPGVHRAAATAPGLVPAFPREVRVG